MRRLTVAALFAAAGLALAAPAQAQELPGPCERAIALIYKYELYPDPGPHFPELDFALGTVCGVTG